MKNNVFVYGSLMYSQVWQKIVAGQYQQKAATIFGYQRLAINGESYPAVVKQQDASVAGIVYLDVDERDLIQLNEFEGEYYQLQNTFAVDDNGNQLRVCFYLFKAQYHFMLTEKSWDKEHFEQQKLGHFIDTYLGFNRE